ncbi:hypothetical protein ACXXHV_11735 [Staphylococcus epidermidis]
MKNKKVYLTDFEKKVLKNDFYSTFLWNYKKVEYILNNSSKNQKFILFIYIIENMNRGGFFNYIFEKALLFFLPNLVIKYDLSIGPFQIKPSFLKFYAPYVNINKFFDLDYCILILDTFLARTNYLESDQQLSLYHSGEINNNYKSTYVYIYMYKWFENHFFI